MIPSDGNGSFDVSKSNELQNADESFGKLISKYITNIDFLIFSVIFIYWVILSIILFGFVITRKQNNSYPARIEMIEFNNEAILERYYEENLCVILKFEIKSI